VLVGVGPGVEGGVLVGGVFVGGCDEGVGFGDEVGGRGVELGVGVVVGGAELTGGSSAGVDVLGAGAAVSSVEASCLFC